MEIAQNADECVTMQKFQPLLKSVSSHKDPLIDEVLATWIPVRATPLGIPLELDPKCALTSGPSFDWWLPLRGLSILVAEESGYSEDRLYYRFREHTYRCTMRVQSGEEVTRLFNECLTWVNPVGLVMSNAWGCGQAGYLANDVEGLLVRAYDDEGFVLFTA